MQRDSFPLIDVQWVARCAHRLRAHWPHADPTSIDEAAAELWSEASLRAMAPVDAAEHWLRLGPLAD